MIYLTYNDQPTGVYFSQVTDVCNYVNRKFNCNIRLVALISFRNFSANKKVIKQNFHKAIVLPMFPKQRNWRRNKSLIKLLFLLIGKQNIWSRGVFATNIAIDLKNNKWTKKVVFDGRGAYEAEYREYLNKIVNVENDIFDLENKAIHYSDFRLSVSNKLVDYWKTKYNYKLNLHAVIPCTLNDSEESTFPSENIIMEMRNELGYNEADVVFVYSGSSADWQSLKLVDDFILSQMKKKLPIKFLLLANSNVEELNSYKEFPNNIIQKWVKPNDVSDYLMASDYGILIRENSVTNQVASPTKFAEYLNAGLNVSISENIGDFSTFTKENACGNVIENLEDDYDFIKSSYSEKLNNFKLAQQHFSKSAYETEYKTIINILK